MSVNLQQARSYIADVDLPPRPSSGAIPQDATPSAPVFDTVKEQAAVVGSEVVSFMAGVDAETRAAISNCALLAQLAASKKVADKEDIYAWYEAYFDVLKALGWVVQDGGFAEFSESSQGFEVHEKIMDVAAVLLGPGAAALAVIKTTLDALKAMKSDNGWLTIFQRESQHAKAARFQISLVQQSNTGDVMVSMMAFGIEASKTVTQVLFFKIKKNKAKLRHNSAKLSIDSASLVDLAPDIRDRVRVYQRAYVASLEI
ncbi:MAG TPA: hypothetical protein VMN38_02065 [Sphingomicrobium sp.]|nr:hypothetical protein [Sphingomicrobium sp.]